jgi:signal transduction histidine kinase
MKTTSNVRSGRLIAASFLLGLFVVLDLGVLGWFIFRSLSQREIEQVLLETREEAEGLADQLTGRISEEEGDLYTVVTVERELQTYIDEILSQRDIVQTVEIRDREGMLVFRSVTEAEVPLEHEGPGPLEQREIPPRVETRTLTRENTFDLDVPIGEVGFLHIGISEEEVGRRIGVLRRELIRQTALIGALTLLVLLLAYATIWWLWRRGRRLEEKALESERMAYIGTLASGLAHEIRNPLNSLNLNMQMLEEEVSERASPGSTRRLLAITRSEIGRLERLVTDFLQYAKPRPLELIQVTVSALLRSCRDVVGGEAQERGVELIVEDRSAGASVRVDSEQMNQLLLNLAQNALAATEGIDRPEIRLIGRCEAGRVLLEVLDNGVGIAPADQAKIFDLFYSTRKGGTGLGLAVVRRIAVAHGGEVKLQSTPGVGTRFQIALPESASPEVSRLSRPVGQSLEAS